MRYIIRKIKDFVFKVKTLIVSAYPSTKSKQSEYTLLEFQIDKKHQQESLQRLQSSLSRFPLQVLLALICLF